MRIEPDRYLKAVYRTVNFGALKPLPPGYEVVYSEVTEHYHALGPDDWESPSCCCRFYARRYAMAHYDDHR